MPAEHELENDAAAEVGEGENAEAAKCPVHRGSATPSETPAPEQKQREHEPGGDRQDGLVREVLAEDVLDEDQSAEQREAEYAESDGDCSEQDALHRLEWRQQSDHATEPMRAQTAILHGHEKREHRRHGERR